jgi:hypothetical protein
VTRRSFDRTNAVQAGVIGRPALLSLALCVTAVLLAVAPAASAGRSSKCQRAKTTTVGATGDLRVYYIGSELDGREYACWEQTGRTTYIGQLFGDERLIQDQVVNGRFVAYLRRVCRRYEGDCRRSDVRVLNVRTGQVRSSPRGGVEFQSSHGIVLDRSGVVAYIAGTTQSYSVHRFDGVSDSVIDPGPTVEPGSIALANETLYWRDDGETLSAQLSGS